MRFGAPIPKAYPAFRWRSILRFTGSILLMGGIGTLIWCGWVITQAYLFQTRAKAELTRAVNSHPEFRAQAPPMQETDFVGQIDIPRLALSAVILEGSSNRTLRLGVGHISGTALPGEAGNVGLTGHRDTFFRPLRGIEKNDEIRLTTRTGSATYRVDWTTVVGPDDTEVLDAGSQPMLTLVTCYPFYYVGPAPKRFIVRAHRVSASGSPVAQQKTAGEPPGSPLPE